MDADLLHLARTIAAKDAEIAELRQERSEQDALRHKLDVILTATANAIKGEPPEDTLHSWHDLPLLAGVAVANEQAMIAEIAALREQCERLAKEVRAWRQAWQRCDIIAHPDGKKAIDSTISTSLNRINGSQLAVDRHNDLQPPAGKESSDGA